MNTLTCQCHETVEIKRGTSVICGCGRMHGISCANCSKITAWKEGKRVVCLHCGSDYGMPIMPGPDGKIHLTWNDRPMICLEIESRAAYMDHLISEFIE